MLQVGTSKLQQLIERSKMKKPSVYGTEAWTSNGQLEKSPLCYPPGQKCYLINRHFH